MLRGRAMYIYASGQIEALSKYGQYKKTMHYTMAIVSTIMPLQQERKIV